MENNNLSVKGRIFDIQKFSTHDGPGIRTIVFFKGCRLRCRWCCNPESQKYEIENMTQNGRTKVIGKDVTVAEVLSEVQKDMPYYRRSGGGLTLSGGEAMCQPEFGIALLKAAHGIGINTCIETTGFAPSEVVDEYVKNLDYVLMDIKHMNSAKSLTIRVPVIPGFNDTTSEILDIARFAKSLGSVSQIHLLPYHKLGYDKYVGLGRNYGMGDAKTPDKEYMKELAFAAQSTGLRVVIGG